MPLTVKNVSEKNHYMPQKPVAINGFVEYTEAEKFNILAGFIFIF